MSLMDLLLGEPSAASEAISMLGSMQSQGGGGGGGGLGSIGTTPPGRGIFGNDLVDVLDPNDPRLVNIGGTQLARPAARSLREILQSLGLQGTDVGGGYRTSGEQASLVASKPGLAAPVGSSFHQEGLAIDLAAALQNRRFENAMRQAGWNQLSGEPWHWSYGVSG